MGRMIKDLHFDLLKCIVILMVKSSDGATNLARAMSVHSMFSKVAEDTDVLKAVCFENVFVHNRCGLFQQTTGLLCRCAQVGNAAAQYLLAKVILMSSSQLMVGLSKRGREQTSSGGHGVMIRQRLCKIPQDDDLVGNFMAHFAPDQTCSTKNSSQTLRHWELLRMFLAVCSTRDITLMHLHLNDYVDYFTERGSRGNIILHHLINKMCHYAHRVRVTEQETLVNRKDVLDNFMAEMEQRIAWQSTRQSNQSVVQEGNTYPLSHLFGEHWHQPMNSKFVYNTYACTSGFEGDGFDLCSEFEECRSSVILCFGNVFFP